MRDVMHPPISLQQQTLFKMCLVALFTKENKVAVWHPLTI